MSTRVRLRLLLLAGTALTAPVYAQELPTGGSVAAGSVDIGAPSAGSMTVNQASPQAIVNWQSFSIGQGGAVTFVQPDGQSVILNRVTGSATTSIAGQLTANGQVYIVNPNGLAITSSGVVSAGGFVGSTLGISDSDFLAGKGNFAGSGSSAGVSNAGSINIVPGGYAALIGGRVDNSGTITAPLGKVGLGAGERVTLDFSGDGFLQVAVPSDSSGEEPLISHSGTISADGGSVHISAAAAQDAARRVVNLSGVVEARTVSGRNGAITLGGGGGHVVVTGRLDVSSAPEPAPVPPPVPQPRPASLGGSVTITGGFISLEGATIEASGIDGGGQIRIGGDLQGGGVIPRAAYLDVDGETVIYADATGNGDGGTVILWSDMVTNYEGFVSARGAGQGKGGFVEVSGKQFLAYQGLVDLRAESGATGTLLLDPWNVTISTNPTSNIGGAPNYAPTGTANLNTTDLANQLALSNVVVTTSGGGPEVGNISLIDPVTWLSANSLTLQADNDISITADVNGGGSLSLQAGNDIAINGDVTVSGAVTLNAIGDVIFLPVDSSIPATITAGAGGLSVTAGGSIADVPLGGGPGAILSTTGNASLTAGTSVLLTGSLTAGGTATVAANGGNLTVASVQGTDDVTLTSSAVANIGTGTITSTGSDVIIAASSLNNTGTPATIDTPDGRFLIYLDTWTGNTLGGLSGLNLYNRTFALNPPGTIGNPGADYFIYEAQPTLTFTAPSGSRVYYEAASGLPAPTFNGLINGDTFAQAVGGTPVATDTSPINAGVGTYTDAVTTTGVTSLIGYLLVFDNGDMTVTPAPLTITASDIDRYLGQNFAFTGTEFTASGLRGTDTVTSASLSSTGTAPSATVAGSPYSILISNAVGPAIGNYTITYVPGTMNVLEVPPNLQPNFPSGSIFTDPPITLANPPDELPGGLFAEVTADDARLSLQILEQRSEEFTDAVAACQLEFEQDGDSNAFIDCTSDALEQYGEAIDDPLIQLPPELQGTVTVIRRTVQRMRTAAANPDPAAAVAEARAAVGDLVDFVREQTALVRAVEPETEALMVQHGNVMAEALGELEVALVGAVEI